MKPASCNFSILVLMSVCLQGCSAILDRGFSKKENELFTTYKPDESVLTPSKISMTYFGTSTLLIDDGITKIMIDGFFTRPRLKDLLSIEPDETLINNIIVDYELQNLAAVIPVHSHHDHIMDAPLFTKFTNAKLLGTHSSFMAGPNLGMDFSKWKEAKLYEPIPFDKFAITLWPADHGPLPSILSSCLNKPRDIEVPIEYPASICDYKLSQPYSIQITNGDFSILVHAGTAYIQGALSRAKADIIFLGIAGLHKLKPLERKLYFQETVEQVGAKIIVPIHWDDFMRSKEGPLQPPKRFMGSFEKAMRALINENNKSNTPAKIILLKKGDRIYIPGS